LAAFENIVDVIRQIIDAQAPVQTSCWERQQRPLPLDDRKLLDLPGVHLLENDEAWFRIERVERLAPPEPSTRLRPWVEVSDDPDSKPYLNEIAEIVIGTRRLRQMRAEGRIDEDDVLHEDLETAHINARLDDHPGIRSDFDDYVANAWGQWAETERPKKVSRELYRTLYELRRDPEAEVAEQPQDLVWGFGLVNWRPESGSSLLYPPLFQTLDVIQEERYSRGSRQNSDQPALFLRPRDLQPRLAYAEFSKVDDGGAAGRLQNWWQELGEGLDLHPADRPRWAGRVREIAQELSADSNFVPVDELPESLQGRVNYPTAYAAQMLFLRKQRIAGKREDALKWLNLIREGGLSEEDLPEVTRVLSGLSGGADPQGLTEQARESLVGVPHDQNGDIIHFPLAANEEQLETVHRLEFGFGAVVQGPPGTGKSHTIANIICHLLATGRRVLVTAKSPGALTVLRDYLPEGLRSLAVSMLAGQREVDDQFDKAVAKLRKDVANASDRQLKEQIENSQSSLKIWHQELIQLQRKIERHVEAHETLLRKVFPEAGGKSLAEEIESFAGREEEFSWLRDQLTLDEEHEPKFGEEDIEKLREARQLLGEDIIHVTGTLPDPAMLPDGARLSRLHRALRHVSSEFRVITDSHDEQQNAYKLLKKTRELVAGDPALPRWAIQYLLEQWVDSREVGELTETLAQFHSRLREIVATWDGVTSDGYHIPASIHTNEKAVKAIHRVAEGRRPWFAGGMLVSSEVKDIVGTISLDDRPLESAEHWQRVHEHIKASHEGEDLIREWAQRFPVRIRNQYSESLEWPGIDGTSHVESAVRSLHLFCESVGRVLQITSHRDDLTEAVHKCFGFATELRPLIGDSARIEKAMDSLRAQYAHSERDELLVAIATVRGYLGEGLRTCVKRLGSDDGVPEEEWNQYRNELLQLRNRLSESIETVQRVEKLIDESGAPQWAERIRAQPCTGDVDPVLPENWRQAWEWRRKHGELSRSGLYEHFVAANKTRREREKQVSASLSRLIEARTLRALKARMTSEILNAINRYQQAIKKIGKGTGKNAPKWRREARRALSDAAPAVPCWIMPEDRVSSEMPAEPGLFDVVIVDEASQSDMTAMLTILRGQKALIVGDDKQVSPEKNFINNTLRDAWARQLHEVNAGVRTQLLEGSLYEAALVSFGGATLMLKEHFRSHPAIIDFCNREFYADEIHPLRRPAQTEAEPPIIVDVEVQPVAEKEATHRNRGEAEAIVAEIESLVRDSGDRKTSIGVVTMLSGAQHAQAKLIDELLLERLGEETMREHRIVVGTPPDFQGKERDVVFLSLIEQAGSVHAKTGARWSQRFNVAVSRARDRLYVVHSFSSANLQNPNDLKKKLLDYIGELEKVPAPDEDAIENVVKECDSKFEQDVARRLLEAGYQVEPQVKVGPYRIDLVVEDYQGRRLAIELDGDRYHGPSRWAEDLFRQRVLERAGWRFWRCFASEYYLDPDGRFAELERAIGEQGIQRGAGASATRIVERRQVGPGCWTVRSDTDQVPEPESAWTEEGVDTAPEDPEPGPIGGSTPRDLFDEEPEEQETEAKVGISDYVEIGDSVRYLDVGKGQESVVQIVNGPGDPSQGIIGPGAPLARAFLVATEGEEVEVDFPTGSRTIRVLEIMKSG